MDLWEKVIAEKYIYKGKILNLRVDTVELPNKTTSTREIIEHSGGVVVLALSSERQVYFVRQYRSPYKKVVLELPAGKLERGEDPLETGKRELKEETGIRAKTYRSLGKFYPTTGYCEEVIHLFLASGLTAGTQNLDENEFLSVEKIPLDEAVNRVLSGEIRDGKTQTALLKVALLLKNGSLALDS